MIYLNLLSDLHSTLIKYKAKLEVSANPKIPFTFHSD